MPAALARRRPDRPGRPLSRVGCRHRSCLRSRRARVSPSRSILVRATPRPAILPTVVAGSWRGLRGLSADAPGTAVCAGPRPVALGGLDRSSSDPRLPRPPGVGRPRPPAVRRPRAQPSVPVGFRLDPARLPPDSGARGPRRACPRAQPSVPVGLPRFPTPAPFPPEFGRPRPHAGAVPWAQPSFPVGLHVDPAAFLYIRRVAPPIPQRRPPIPPRRPPYPPNPPGVGNGRSGGASTHHILAQRRALCNSRPT